MITPRGVVRVTLTLDPVDLDLIDRLAALEGSNRSAEVRSMLLQLRPLLSQTVDLFEAAERSREDFARVVAESEFMGTLEAVGPEIERIQAVLLGSMARLEGAASAADPEDPRRSNHGGHTPPEILL